MKKLFNLLILVSLIIISPVFTFGQSTWFEVTSLQTVQNLNSVFFLNDGNGWICADSCLVFKTADGGDTWQRTYIAASTDAAYPLRDIQFVTSDTGFAAGDSGYVYVTTDAGATWSSKDSATTKFVHTTINALYFISGYEGWIVGNGGKISHTTDGGNSWSSQDTITSLNLYDAEFISNNGWMVGENGDIFHTLDNGATWQSQGDTLPVIPRYGLDFIDPNNGWIAGGPAPYIFKTTNGGNFWIGQTGPSQYMYSIAMRDINEGWSVGQVASIFFTNDGGTNWTFDTTGIGQGYTDNFNDVAFIPSGRFWIVGNTGKIVATYAGAPPPPPTYHYPDFYPILKRGVAIGDTMQFTLTASDPDGDPLNWSASNLPPLATFNPGTQEFKWIPTLGEIGSWWVTFNIDDGTGNTVKKDVEIFSVVNGWYPVQTGDAYPALMSVTFQSDLEGWACGYTSKISHTTNGGAEWYWQDVTAPNDLIDIDFIDLNNGWAVGNNGTIINTNDGGATTWNIQTSGTSENLLGVSFVDSTNGWAVGENGTILFTTNGGSTWAPQTSNTTESLRSAHFVDAAYGWAVGTNGTILYTNNGGTNWSLQTSGTTEYLRNVYFLDSSTGWAVGDNGTILVTNNGGTNWNPQTSGVPNSLRRVYFIDPSTGWIVGREGTILYTNNGGTNWNPQSSGTTTHLLGVYFNDSSNGWITGSSIILHTVNGGTNWSLQTSGTDQTFDDVIFVDPDNGWISGNEIRHTADGGKTWNTQFESSDYLEKLYFSDLNNGWAVGYNGTIIHTSDGTNWSAQTSGTTAALYSVHFADASNGWAVGDSGKILNTNNGGVNWNPQNSGISNTLRGVYFINATTGYAVGYGGMILKTNDAGTNWTTQYSGGSPDFTGVYFISPDTGWVVGSDGSIMHTVNGGGTWAGQVNPLGGYFESIYFADAAFGWACGPSNSVVYTTNGGSTWEPQDTRLNQNTYSIHMSDPDNGWGVGTYETIWKYKSPIYFSFFETIADPGDTVNLQVEVIGSDYFDIFSFQFTIGFEDSLAELIGFDTTGSLIQGFMLDSSFTSIDTFKMVGSSVEPLGGSGIFMGLKYVVSQDAPALDTIYITYDEFIVNEGYPDILGVVPGKIIVTGPKFGDVSQNGNVESFDASLVLQYRVDKIVLNDTALTAAEVTNNGTITAFDAAMILRFVAGHIGSFPSGEMFAPKEAFINSKAFLAKQFEDDKMVEYTIHLEDIKDMYSSEVSLAISGLELTACEKTGITNNYLIEDNLKNGILKIAVAGAEPVKDSGEIIKLKFRKISEVSSVSLNDVIVNETEITVTEEIADLLPDYYDLHQNYPNPFNSETVIKYQLPEAGNVEIAIYNIIGQRVRTLVNKDMNAGFFTTKWDGRNDYGISVASGVYIVKIKANSFAKTKKMIYLR